ncbi:MAG: hypothetical protein ACFB3T_12065 [Geminicoccaceae bacterium]
MLELFADRTYRHLFAAQVIALLGTGLATLALGLMAYEPAALRLAVSRRMACWLGFGLVALTAACVPVVETESVRPTSEVETAPQPAQMFVRKQVLMGPGGDVIEVTEVSDADALALIAVFPKRPAWLELADRPASNAQRAFHPTVAYGLTGSSVRPGTRGAYEIDHYELVGSEDSCVAIQHLGNAAPVVVLAIRCSPVQTWNNETVLLDLIASL